MTLLRCIDAHFERWVWAYVEEVPVEGGINTIREICLEASDCLLDKSAVGFSSVTAPESSASCESNRVTQDIRPARL